MPQDEEIASNLLYKAYHKFRAEIGLKSSSHCIDRINGIDETNGLAIHLIKNVPVAAGLGSASSSAAALLKIMRFLFKPDLPLHKLSDLAVDLGADIPLFIKGTSAWGEGIGDKLSPQNIAQYYYLLFCPDIKVSTKELFTLLDKHNINTHPNSYIGKTKLGEQQILKLEAGTANDFVAPLFAKFPQLLELQHNLAALTPNRISKDILLSGTGGTLFAVYKDKIAAQQDKDNILNNYSSDNCLDKYRDKPVSFTTHLIAGINSSCEVTDNTL